MSRTSRRDGRIGKIHSFCATYSFRMSVWQVPESRFGSFPRASPSATYMASRIQAVGLIVIETEMRSRSIPSKSASTSSRVSTATPSRRSGLPIRPPRRPERHVQGGQDPGGRVDPHRDGEGLEVDALEERLDD